MSTVTSCEYLIVLKDGTVCEGTVIPIVPQSMSSIKLSVYLLHEIDTPDIESTYWNIKAP